MVNYNKAKEHNAKVQEKIDAHNEDMKKIAKNFGKEFSCSAKQTVDDKFGEIIVIQGDFCIKMKQYLYMTENVLFAIILLNCWN